MSSCRFETAPADGCQASRSVPRRVRRPRFVTARLDVTRSVRRTDFGTVRESSTARGDAARSVSTTHKSTTRAIQRTIVRPAGTSSTATTPSAVSYTHLRAHETDSYLVCRLLLE